MKKNNAVVMMMAVMTVCVSMLPSLAQATTTIRANAMTQSSWTNLARGALGEEIVVEFRRGDELPLSLEANGDLLETTKPAVSYVGVKRDFWLKVHQDEIQISLDGTTYKKMSDALKGNLTAGANSDQNGGAASTIQVVFSAFLK